MPGSRSLPGVGMPGLRSLLGVVGYVQGVFQGLLAVGVGIPQG